MLILGCIWLFSLETTALIRGVFGHLLTFATGGFATPVPIISFPFDDLVDILGRGFTEIGYVPESRVIFKSFR